MSGYSGSGVTSPSYASGKYYIPDGSYQIAAGNAASSGLVRMAPGSLRRTVTISSLSVRLTTAAAGGLFQIAIYAADPVTAYPTGAAVYTSASQSTASAALVEITGLGLTLPQGNYYFAVNVDATGANAAFASQVSVSPATQQLVGSSATTNIIAPGGNFNAYQRTSTTFGTWPALTGNLTTDGITEIAGGSYAAVVAFKVA